MGPNGLGGAPVDRGAGAAHYFGMKVRGLIQTVISLALGLAVLAGVPGAVAKSATAEKRAEIDEMADAMLDELYQLKPIAKDQVKKAAGYAVFSNVGVNLVFASFAGGKGVVVGKRGQRTYMKMGSAGLGLGLGVKDFRAVFVFRTKAKLDAFLEQGWDFSGQADAAAKSEDKGKALALAQTVIPDVEIYQITKNGLALQATLQGTKYWKDKDLN
jgi:lipid-binding SYLF domain-containing protein